MRRVVQPSSPQSAAPETSVGEDTDSARRIGVGSGSAFLYESVSQALRERIEQGVYRHGDRIPGLGELSREFGVSAITIRRAVRDLTLEGLLMGRQGLGTFVAHRRRITRSLKAGRMASLGEEIERAGFTPSIRELSLALMGGEEEGTRRLTLPADALVYRLERVILADGEPLSVDTTWFRRELGERLKDELVGRFMPPLLKAHGIILDLLDYRIEGATSTDADGALLNVPVGFPLLVIYYTAFDAKGVPALAGRTASRADRIAYEFSGRMGRCPALP